MISWIQNHLIRHGRWIFLSLLALIIVAFVFTIGNTPGCTTDNSSYEEQYFYGIDMNAPRERDVIVEKVQLSVYFNSQQIRSDQQFQSQVINRIAKLHLADEIGIPSPNEAALAEYIKTKPAFRGQDGQFSADSYTSFIDTVESNPRMQVGLVAIVLEEDYRIDQITSALTGPGYVLPSEAKAQTQSSQTTLTLTTAEIAYKDFAPEIAPDEATLKSFFENNAARYEIPERIKASYAFFPAKKYSDQVTELADAALRDHFIANRAKFVDAFTALQPTPAEGEEAPAVTFEDVRPSVEASLKAESAERLANEAAQAFAYKLYRDEIAHKSAAFNKLVNESGLSLTAIEPYSAQGASQRALSAEMLQSAFALGGNRYFSDAYAIDGGFAVLIYEGRIAPELPAFETVQAEVLANYQSEEKRALFNKKGESLKAELEAKLAEGTSFADAAAALDLGVNSYEAFKVADAPRELNRTALQTAQGMNAGEVSAMFTASDIGTFVYLENKEVPEIAEDDEDMTQALSFLAYMSSSVSNSSTVNELVARGLPETEEETTAEVE
ncbi:MAG: SurA N-terminal domain-containing protein [Opitutaceae bacterium]